MPSLKSAFLAAFLFLTPCGAHAADAVATVYPVWLLLREVAAGVSGMDCSLLLPASTGCPHDYSMTPLDRRKLAEADILVINGLGLESSLGDGEKLLSMMKPGAVVIDCSEGIEGIISEAGPAAHGKANPHIFASPSMMMRMARSLEQGLARIDPGHAPEYAKGRASVEARLAGPAARISAISGKARGRSVIPQHDIFDYLARDAGLSVPAHVRSNEEISPSAAELAALVRLARKGGVAAVITEPQYPDRTANTLCGESGVPCISLDPSATGSEEDGFDGYLRTLGRNIDELERILGS